MNIQRSAYNSLQEFEDIKPNTTIFDDGLTIILQGQALSLTRTSKNNYNLVRIRAYMPVEIFNKSSFLEAMGILSQWIKEGGQI